MKGLLRWTYREAVFLDELDLAINLFQERRNASLSPKYDVIHAIVKAASNYHEEMVPPDSPNIEKVPHTVDDWVILMNRVLQEAEGSRLVHNQQFVEEVTAALQRLGQEQRASAWIRKAYGISF